MLDAVNCENDLGLTLELSSVSITVVYFWTWFYRYDSWTAVFNFVLFVFCFVKDHAKNFVEVLLFKIDVNWIGYR